MATIGLLVVLPLIAAAALFFIKKDSLRTPVVIGFAALIMLACVWLAIGHLTGTMEFYPLKSQLITYATLVIDVILGVYVFVKGIKHGVPFASVLAGIQTAIVVVFELTVAHGVNIDNDIYVIAFGDDGDDHRFVRYQVSVSNALANEVSKENIRMQPDRRHIFFSIFFLFLSACSRWSSPIIWHGCSAPGKLTTVLFISFG